MTTDDNFSFFEKRILGELEDLERRIKELQNEKITLAKQLSKIRAEREGLQYTTRKNSLNRVLAENSIINALKSQNAPMSARVLFGYAKSTNFDLKEATFRTYLNRMKTKGIIRPSKSSGHWQLA